MRRGGGAEGVLAARRSGGGAEAGGAGDAQRERREWRRRVGAGCERREYWRRRRCVRERGVAPARGAGRGGWRVCGGEEVGNWISRVSVDGVWA